MTPENFPLILDQNLGTDDLPELRFIDDNGDEIIRISTPTGLNIEEVNGVPFNGVPVPMAQVGIGLFKGTEVKLRHMPEIDFDGEGSFQMFGIGVMHDIKSYLPEENYFQ